MIAPADFSSSFKPMRAPSDRTERGATSRQEALYDAELVRRFNAGDDTAFVEIMSRYRERMFLIAYAMLKNHADAEEIAQDTFIRAYRGLAKFRGDASLATWLHRITLNLARNRYWYFFRRRRHSTLSLDSACSDGNPATFSDLVATDNANPARAATVSEFSDLVTACMARLSPRHREVLALRNSMNRSYGDIARELAISVGTVKSRIARARESLRLLLVETCPEFGPEDQPAAWLDLVRSTGGIAAICA